MSTCYFVNKLTIVKSIVPLLCFPSPIEPNRIALNSYEIFTIHPLDIFFVNKRRTRIYEKVNSQSETLNKKKEKKENPICQNSSAENCRQPFRTNRVQIRGKRYVLGKQENPGTRLRTYSDEETENYAWGRDRARMLRGEEGRDVIGARLKRRPIIWPP